jgi:large subunit ribosomal protein L17
MMRNLTMSVLRYERVKTTEAKAKEIRGYVDRMINLGKDGGLDARRRAAAWLPETVIVNKVFDDLAKRYTDRTSGYTRTTRLPRRVGDNAELMLLELMPGALEPKAAEAAEEKPKRRRLGLPRRAPKAEKTETTGAAKKSPAKKPAGRKKATAKSSSKED